MVADTDKNKKHERYSRYSFIEKYSTENAEYFSMEGPVRLELTTPCLKGRCSNRLSYGPVTVRIYHFTGNIVKVAR